MQIFPDRTGQTIGTLSPIAPRWVSDAVFYQIVPDRFCIGYPALKPHHASAWDDCPTTCSVFGGNLQGIVGKLDYLQSLGVTALYLTPIFASPSSHKYNTTDYLSIDPHFGDERTFAWLVKSCHARGMRIILDAVFNHTGTDFFAFSDLRQRGEASAYRDWYFIHEFPVDPQKPTYECWWDHASLPRLNTSNPQVREYLFHVTRHWMQFGIDGWRLDVPNEVPEDFWREWRMLVKGLNPEAYIVGEIWDDAMAWLQGDQFDGVMNYVVRDACVRLFGKKSITVSEFDEVLARQRARYPGGTVYGLLNLLGSHDTERFMTVCGGDERAVKLATLFLMTYPGAPMIYYGDERGMKGGKDPACRETMKWNGAHQGASLSCFFRDVMHMRQAHEVLRCGTFEALLCDDAPGVYVYKREFQNSLALVVLHNGSRRVQLDIQQAASCGTGWQQAWPLQEPEEPVDISFAHPLSLGSREGRVYIGRRAS